MNYNLWRVGWGKNGNMRLNIVVNFFHVRIAQIAFRPKSSNGMGLSVRHACTAACTKSYVQRK